MTLQVVLLAGGLGTRLREVSAETPKPLMPVAGKPFIQHLIEEYRRFGFRKFLVLAGFRGHQVTEFFASQPTDGVAIDVLIEAQPQGTAGALREARSHLEETFLLANADSFFDINYLDFACNAPGEPCLAKLALCWIDHADRYGVVELEGARIVRFQDKGHSDRGLINGGIYCMHRTVVDMIGPGAISLEGSVLPLVAAQGRLQGKVFEGSFIDIGIPSSYHQAQSLLNDVLSRRIAFLTRDSLINVREPHAPRIDQCRWIEGAKDAVKTLNDAHYLVIVVTKPTGIAQELHDNGTSRALHHLMNEELRRAGAHVDAVYDYPHSRDGTTMATLDGQGKEPYSAMLLRAMSEWPSRKDGTFIIGNEVTDMDAGRGATISGHLFGEGNLEFFVKQIVKSQTPKADGIHVPRRN